MLWNSVRMTVWKACFAYTSRGPTGPIRSHIWNLGHPGPVQSGSDDRILRSKSHRVGGGGGNDYSKFTVMVRLVVGPKRGMLNTQGRLQRGQGIGLLDLEPKQSVRLGHSPALLWADDP